MDWLLYDNGPRHERVNIALMLLSFLLLMNLLYTSSFISLVGYVKFSCKIWINAVKSLNGEVGIQVRFWIATTVETFRHQKKRYEFIISPYFVV